MVRLLFEDTRFAVRHATVVFDGCVLGSDGLKQFLTEKRWFEWVPDAGLVEAPGRGDQRIVAVRVSNRKAILVYFPVKRQAVIELPDSMHDDTMALTWFDTASGARVLQEATSSSRRMTLTPPDAFEDAVVVLAPKDAE